jgi:hypothetical protein
MLRASAVELRNGAVAFIASSGGGESTVAATLCATGARLVSDDLLWLGVETPRHLLSSWIRAVHRGDGQLGVYAVQASLNYLHRRRAARSGTEVKGDRPLKLSAIILMLRPQSTRPRFGS